MNNSDRHDRPSSTIARTVAQAATLSERAIVVGNRAGVVEWVNAAWTRITGFSRAETISKPITHFLEQASIELDLVDFVGQHFLEGLACRIEFPFETFDARSIWVHLEVHPIRNAQGEISDFVAVATDASERRLQDLETIRPQPSVQVYGTEAKPATVHHARLSLSAEAQTVCEPFMRLAGPRTHFDVCLDRSLPKIRSNHFLLAETIRLLIRAASMEVDESWGFVSVMSGRTRVGRSHISAIHPIPARSAELAQGPLLFLEVHDTAPTLTPDILEAIGAGEQTDEPRSQALGMAAKLATALGGSLHIDSTPGCGTQALLLLPIR